MKKYFFLIFLLFFALFYQPSLASTRTKSIDLKAQGDAKIQKSLDDIESFIIHYTAAKPYLTQLQEQQIESQYKGLQDALNNIKKNLDKDSGDNLETDYNSIDSGLYIYELKLPELYSEIFLYKSMYLEKIINNVNTLLLPQMINRLSAKDHQQGLNFSQDMIIVANNIANEQQAISNSYSDLSNLQSNSANSSNFKTIFVSIKTNQQRVSSNIKQYNNDLLQLISLT